MAPDLQNVLGIVRSDTHRLAVVGWLPAEPNHTITIPRTLAEAAGEQRPLLVLGGSTALRQHQTAGAVASLDAWYLLAWEADLALVECEFAELTDEMKHRLWDAVGQEKSVSQTAANRTHATHQTSPDPSCCGQSEGSYDGRRVAAAPLVPPSNKPPPRPLAIRIDPSQPDTENRANTEDRRTVRVHHLGYSSAIRWERPGHGCPSTDRPWTGFTRRG